MSPKRVTRPAGGLAPTLRSLRRPTPRRRAAMHFSTAFPKARWRDSPDELLAHETLDFVDICAPPGAHAQLIIEALERGLHVLSEKPLVTRVEDAEAIRKAAVRAGRVVHTVHNWLKAPICEKISALVAEGAIGAVKRVAWRTLRTQPAVAAGPPGVANWRVDPAIGRRGNPVRPRLARALLRRALGGRSARGVSAP